MAYEPVGYYGALNILALCMEIFGFTLLLTQVSKWVQKTGERLGDSKKEIKQARQLIIKWGIYFTIAGLALQIIVIILGGYFPDLFSSSQYLNVDQKSNSADENFNRDFLYPLYLLLIGAVISGLLIPYFISLHESKLKKLEIIREDSQKKIDRAREDFRHSLTIQHELIEKITKSFFSLYSLAGSQGMKFKGNEKTLTFDEITNIATEILVIDSIIRIYYDKDSEVIKEWTRMEAITTDMIDCVFPQDGANNDHSLQDLLKLGKSKINFDEAKKILRDVGFSDIIDKIDVAVVPLLELIRLNPPMFKARDT